MKANELRIGNFIADYEAEPNKTIYWQVETIEHLNKTLGVRFRNGSCWTCEEMIEPIPLTEEWLLKFGFEFYETEKANNYIMKKSWRFTFPTEGKNKGSMYLHYGNIIWHNSSNMQYVHQLQNLYFALMGEELTIKQS